MKEKTAHAFLSFFVIMLCCTIVSRAADSVTIARVETTVCKKGNLTHSFSGTGKLQAKSRAFQFLPANQKVAAILAKPGNPVEAGQALIQLDAGYLEEQISGKDREIRKLKLQIELQKINGAVPARLPATAQAELSLDAARKDRDSARDAYQQALDAYHNYVGSAEYQQAITAKGKENLPTPPDTPKESASPSDIPKEGAASPSDAPKEEAPLSASDAAAKAEQKRQELMAKAGAAEAQLNAAQEIYDRAKGSYQLALKEEENARSNEARQERSSRLTLQGLSLDLEELEEDLKKLKEIQNSGCMVTARESGILESAGVSEGSITSGTEPVILSSEEQEACGEIPAGEIGRVNPGDEVEILIAGAGKAVPLSIERLEADAQGSLFWFAPFTGSASGGTPFSYDYSQQSTASYEQLIPLSALREASGVAYVLTAQVRPGILGDSCTAVKVPVTLLAKDGQRAAIQASIGNDALIITSSNKYVKEGDRVRLSD